MPKANVAVHAGTRRSEKKTPFPYLEGDIRRSDGLHKEEDPLHPGFHTVLVPRHDPRDPKAASPIGAYVGMGYKDMNAGAEETGHSDQVKMGIPLNVWLEREQERVAADNEALTYLVEDVALGNLPGIKFDRSNSGYQQGAQTTVGDIVNTLPSGPKRGKPDAQD